LPNGELGGQEFLVSALIIGEKLKRSHKTALNPEHATKGHEMAQFPQETRCGRLETGEAVSHRQQDHFYYSHEELLGRVMTLD
jgi:hypothetical protein